MVSSSENHRSVRHFLTELYSLFISLASGRVTAELHRRGRAVNHERVARILATENLLGIQPKRFVGTTNSRHKLEVYLNLVGRMKMTGSNQLWVTDITHIRLKWEFLHLAIILDTFSRKAVGWSLVHHSARGLQSACAEYAAILDKHRITLSMSRPANPYDKASCEGFMNTLMRGEIYADRYDHLEQLGANIEEFIEQYYNRLRLHSALGYQTSNEFE